MKKIIQNKISNYFGPPRQYCVLALLLMCHIISDAQYQVGKSYLSVDGYVEYIAGDMPLIISAPHGGEKNPQSIMDRNCASCITVNDDKTQELIREIANSIKLRYGCTPHLIINRLARKKLDANREIIEATDNNSLTMPAWYAYHSYIQDAKNQILKSFDKGLFIDVHGHAHAIQRIELGYLLTGDDLRNGDNIVDKNFLQKSSIKNLVLSNEKKFSLSQLLRGEQSLGTFLEQSNYATVPSARDLFPLNGEPYFNGGYNTVRHGSRDSGTIDAIQIECNFDIRKDDAIRKEFAKNLGNSLYKYLETYYTKSLENICVTTGSNEIELGYSISPNPTTHYLKIETSHGGDEYFEIYDAMGKKRIATMQSTIDVSALQAGYYFLKVASKLGRIYTSKFTKW